MFAAGNFPEGFGSLSIGFYNGEGYAGRELNQGKQVQGALTLRPAAMTEVGKPFTLFASFLYGTEGAGNSRAHRVTGGIFWDQAVFAAGVHTTYIWGVEGDGGQEGVMAEGFLRSRPWEGLILVARGIHYVRDLSLADDTISLFNAAVGYEVAPPLQVFASVEKTWIGHDYANTHHDAQRWSFMISLRGAFAPELHVGLASDTPASALAPTTP